MKDPIAAPPRLRDDPDLKRIGFGAERADTTFDVEALALRLDAQIAAGALPRLDPTALSGMRGLILGAVAGLVVGAAAATVVARAPGSASAVSVVAVAPPPPAATAAAVPTEPAPPPAVSAVVVASPARVAPPAGLEGGLSAELAFLDRAEAARRAGRLDVAAAELRAYHKRFPAGQLVVEAELALLAVRVAQRDGDAVQVQGERLLKDPRFADRAAEIRAAMERTRNGP